MTKSQWFDEENPDFPLAPVYLLGKKNADKNKGMKENNLLSLSYGNIIRKSIDDTGGLRPDSFETYQVVQPGDTVLRFTDLQNDHKSLRSGLVTEKGIITSAYIGFRPNPRMVNPPYFAYTMRALDGMKAFYEMGSGVRQSLNWEEFSALYIPLPDLETQRHIADYLDREISEIDALIEEFEGLTTDLENRATPFGKRYLDELEDAGIGLTHLGLHASFIGGSGFNERYQGVEGEELPFYKVGSLSTMDSKAIVQDFSNTVSRETAKEIGARLVPAGSILLAKVGEAMRLNRFGINSVDCCIDNNMLSVQPDLQVLDTDYLRLALTQLPIDILINPGPVPSLNTAAFRSFKFPLPNLNTQREVATSWQREMEKSAALIEESTRLIGNLKARKTALITEAVTGRKEV